jgi:hypothetical protein
MEQVPTHPGNQQQQAPRASGREFFTPSPSLQRPQEQGLGEPVAAVSPQVSPEQVQAEQLAQAIASGEIQGDQLQGMANQDPQSVPMIQAAVQMASDMQKRTEAQYAAAQQSQGLGAF